MFSLLLKDLISDFIFTYLNLFGLLESHVADFSTRNKILTAKLLKQDYRYHKLRKTFSKFYRRHYDLVSKFNVGLKKVNRKVQEEPQAEAAANPQHQEEEKK